jgi:thiol-disulfide isomerase/thioredoxin
MMAAPVRAADAVVVGAAAPALVAQSFDNRPIDLAALRGRVVVLNFWASWCGPCRGEMPMLDALAREYRARGVVVVGMSADDRHDRKDAQRAAQAVGYLTGMLTEARVNDFGEPRVLPLTYIIAPSGVVAAVLRANQGPLSERELRAVVDGQLVDKTSIAPRSQ